MLQVSPVASRSRPVRSKLTPAGVVPRSAPAWYSAEPVLSVRSPLSASTKALPYTSDATDPAPGAVPSLLVLLLHSASNVDE